MEYSTSASTLSRKLSSDFAGKSIYDGVFAAPTKCAAANLSSPVEDYREIFGGGDGSRGSSIPVLDVPELRERKVSVDVRSSNLDYADIFGSFGDSDYAVPLEELIAKPRKGRSSSKEACTPAYSTSPSGGSNLSNCSQENRSSPCEAPCQSFEEVKQFNMLYHKTNQGSENGTNGRTHIAQLHAVPAYTRLIDETAPLQRVQDDSPVTSVGRDMHFNVHCGDGTTEGKYSQKPMSGLPPGGTNKLTSEGGVKTQKKSMRDKSFSSDILFDIKNFGLGTDPPKIPLSSSLSSSAGNSDLDSKGSVASKFEGSSFDASEADAGASSPPYFGEELDKNSVAAASAAAVKLAIEKAQARMKLAKELMERKKGGRHSREKLSCKDGMRAEKKRGEKVSGKAKILKNEMAQEICDKVDTPIELTVWMKTKNAIKVGEVNPDSGDKKELFSNKEAVGGMQQQELKTAQADHILGEIKEPETEEMFCELVRTGKHNTMTLEVKEAGHGNKNMSSTKACEQEDIGMADSTVEEPVDNGIKYKADDDVCNKEDSEKKLHASEGEHELEACENTLTSCQQIHDQEVEKKLELLQEHEETEKEENIPNEQDECDEKQKKPLESMGISENVEAQELEEKKIMGLEEAHERTENDKKREEAKEQEECVNGSKKIQEMVTEVRRLEDNFGLEENGKRLDGSCGREENEKETEESCRWEESEKQQKEAECEEKLEKSGDQVHKQEMVGERCSNFDEGEESDEYFEDSKSEENEKLDEGGENEKEINESCQILEDEVRQEEACEWEDTAEIWTEINQRGGEEEEQEEEKTVETLKCHKNNFEATDDTCKHDEHQHLSETKETCMQKEIDKHVESTSEATVHEEDASIMEASTSYFEARDNEKGSESVEVRNDLDYNEIFDTNGMTDGALELDEMIKQMKEANEALFFNANGGDSGKAEISLGKKENDQYASEIVFNLEKHFNGLVCELGENDKSVKEAELSSSHEENGNNLKTAHEERWVHSREVEAAHQQPSTSDRREKTAEDQEFNSSPEIIEENHHETLIIEEIETKYTWQKVDLEKEHTKNLDEAKAREKEHSRKLDEAKEKEQENNRKLDEAKEKEKEKEKERIAVERVIREARERAFAEARDRAAMEKLTSGAKRRPVTEARERLGKVSVGANLQSSADKEAKLKAERAAVERATAEARDRALEKAKSGKAASDARNQAEKYSGGSKDDGIRQSFPSDTQFRASGPSSSSRSSNSSNQGERSEGANSELAQRFKAEWERQQRTAERAAKALAEKNMRDLLAQEEQAERNRLAEPLDADIKRWSSGKEGNLRALLSTLQYILGPDSGWQPVPLTDIIATAAVKKTYRRATLFVHPDKLQQRGASIQQKYMCEKVFDLLKEAWDKFNREER